MPHDDDDDHHHHGDPGRELVAREGLRWENWLDEQGFVPALTFDVAREDEVAQVVRRACRDGRRVHAAGAGLAASPLVATDGYLVETGRLSGVTRVPADELLGAVGPCVRVLAGTRLHALRTALDAMGLAMPAGGGAGLESIGGAVATGTHGSSLSFGLLADLVRSVDLVAGDGRRWRVEPARGFTRHGTEPPGVERRDDDDWFHSTVVGVGVAGLVTSLVLEVREAFDLEERRALTTWEALAASPDTDEAIARATSYELWLNPYPGRSGLHTALSTVRVPAPPGAPRRPRAPSRLLALPPVRWAVALGLDACPRLVPWALDTMLSLQATRAPAVDASHRLFDLGPLHRLPTAASEWFFPMSRWKEAVSALLAEAERLRARPQAITSCPFCVRFVRASPHFLAMSEGEAEASFCAVAVPVFSSEHDRRTLQYRFDLLATRLGGRPHWGHHHRARPARLERRYAKACRFLAVRAALDPTERFANTSSFAEGLTPSPVPSPVLGRVDTFDTSVPREVLPLGAARTPVQVDVRRFTLAAPVPEVVRAFQEVLQQPGRLVARRFEVLRAPGRAGLPFVLGERFQGRFALDARLLEDTRRNPSVGARLLRALGARDVLQALEDDGLSNFGVMTELDLAPAPGAPATISYAYLTGTPFAGQSRFTVTPDGPHRCRYVQQLTFQPLDELKELVMDLVGLRLHNQVVFGQVEAAADWLGVDFEPLDLEHLGTATGPVPRTDGG